MEQERAVLSFGLFPEELMNSPLKIIPNAPFLIADKRSPPRFAFLVSLQFLSSASHFEYFCGLVVVENDQIVATIPSPEGRGHSFVSLYCFTGERLLYIGDMDDEIKVALGGISEKGGWLKKGKGGWRQLGKGRELGFRIVGPEGLSPQETQQLNQALRQLFVGNLLVVFMFGGAYRPIAEEGLVLG